ncbi:circularly permuted type 2 ATP-grasp protein [Chrysiogenes arsenatis]|uniref:circularly permuted type 2 ATP-grasp protein n=1 Tax=Chrysiogenes arsenatis TaxID=309797 RepID=UPI0003FE29D2|nr:circularly permuted type 2 ATP-grasp protein [Chrysiogenes arsenatis]
MNFNEYEVGEFYDEMFDASGKPRPATKLLYERITSLKPGELKMRQAASEKALLDLGITFTVYGNEEGTEKVFPFDVLPRVISGEEWQELERGLRQRIVALNMFIDDVYNDQQIIKDGIIPREIVESSAGYLPSCLGLNPPRNIWCHIAGSDLVRDETGQMYVLEDNLRCPSGVSYVLANRHLMKRTFPKVFAQLEILPVVDYPARLLDMLISVAPQGTPNPTVVLLTPGSYNSAYFEHSFLAQQMGIELVEGRDLVVHEGFVCMRTTKGLRRVDVIYRRIGDDYLDPEVFRPESVLGVSGIMDVYRAGRVTLVNAPGAGVADDKVIYAYVPEMIRYYLDEEALIPNVPTYLCWREEDRKYVLANLPTMVVKAANEAGGYGMLIGPGSTKEQQDEFAKKIVDNPRNYIAQPALKLSRTPVIAGDTFEGRHIDLRPYILYGDEISITPGGLTRVALKKGSLVVNSSQGGGSKDTWVLAPGPVKEVFDAQ